MSKMIQQPQHHLLSLLIGLALATGSGCSHFKPTITDRARTAEGITPNNEQPNKTYRITDRNVVDFANKVSLDLQEGRQWAIILRETSSTIQVLAAATAASLGVAGAGSVQLITAVSAGGAVIPQLQGIFQAKERAKAYDQGLELIDKAMCRYQKAIVSVNGAVAADKLTMAGAELAEETLAALQIVHKLMITVLPDIKELETARGVRPLAIRAAQGDVIIDLDEQGIQVLSEVGIVANGPATSVTSSDLSVATAAADASGMKVIVTGIKDGDAIISLANARGEVGRVNVRVNGAPRIEGIAQFDAAAMRTIKLNGKLPLHYFSASNVQATSSDESIVAITVDTGRKQIVLTGKKEGEASIQIQNENRKLPARNLPVKVVP